MRILSVIIFTLFLAFGVEQGFSQTTSSSPKPGAGFSMTTDVVVKVLKAAEPICCVDFVILWGEYQAGTCVVAFDYKDAAGYHFRVIRGGGTGISIVISNL